jgi:hypothetical protein
MNPSMFFNFIIYACNTNVSNLRLLDQTLFICFMNNKLHDSNTQELKYQFLMVPIF